MQRGAWAVCSHRDGNKCRFSQRIGHHRLPAIAQAWDIVRARSATVHEAFAAICSRRGRNRNGVARNSSVPCIAEKKRRHPCRCRRRSVTPSRHLSPSHEGLTAFPFDGTRGILQCFSEVSDHRRLRTHRYQYRNLAAVRYRVDRREWHRPSTDPQCSTRDWWPAAPSSGSTRRSIAAA